MFGIPAFDPGLHSGENLAARNPELLEPILKAVRWASRHYFRTEISGWENLPSSGRMLLVGNHNGGFASPDMFIFFTSWHDRFGQTRPLYAIAHSGVIEDIPLAASFLTTAGAVKGTRENALQVLKHDNASLMVYPGGGVDLFRPFSDRYKIELAGHMGFIRLALEAQVPIVPVVSCGAHESTIILSSNRGLMKKLGLNRRGVPVWPLMLGIPWGPVLFPAPSLPLPTRVQIHIEQPISLEVYSPQDAEDEGVVRKIYNQVRWRMQARMTELAGKRRYPAFA